jgi:predicted branched-subunit amino acid permease
MPVPPVDAPVRPLWRDPDFRRGFRDMHAVSLGIAAWGLLTGVAMANSGLPLPLMLLMSLLVFAGSAQLAALPLMASGAPVWLVWAAALCVNLRFVLLSAGWRRFFAHLPRGERMRIAYFAADLNYVQFMKRYPEPRPAPGQVAYFWGGVASNWPAWQVPSLAGILLADRIPLSWGLGFAGTLALLGITYSLMHGRAAWVAAGVAGAAAVATYALPLKLNLLVAIAAATAMGLLMDRVRKT